MPKIMSALGGLFAAVSVGVVAFATAMAMAPEDVPFRIVSTGSLESIGKISLLIFAMSVLVCCAFRCIRCLDKDEQIRIQYLTGTTVRNGPGMVLLNPFGHRSAVVVKVDMLATLDYAVVLDTVNGVERVQCGPALLFLGPHEKVKTKGQGTSLSTGEYLLVEDKLSCQKKVVKGPCVWFPGPHDVSQKGASLALSKTEYVKVEDKISGEKHVVQGPCILYPGPHESGKKGASINLNVTEYIIVEDQLTGVMTTVKGPRVWFPGPYDAPSAKQAAISLQEDEYVRLKDISSGQRWVQQGKGLVFLEPTWQVEGSTQKAWILKANEYIRLLMSALER
jgi:hypothetical protein